jgi:hypothetical protein
VRARLVTLLTDLRTVDGCAFSLGALVVLAIRALA